MNLNDPDKSYRKPYVAKMEHNWWTKLSYYVFYIVRESTSFFMLWISIVLMYGVICSYTNPIGQDEFYRFIFFLQHPVVVILNVLALLAALLHSLTWFNLAPKAANVVIVGKKPPAILFIVALWGLTIVVSAILLLVIFGYFR